MYESYDQCRIPQRPRFEWEEQFYKALSTSRDANEANAAAEWILFSRLTENESHPLQADERAAMDDCLFVLRRFQVEQLDYPRLDLHVDEVNFADRRRKTDRARVRGNRGPADAAARAALFPAKITARIAWY